ncbi:hypothetical protein GCM10019017_58210 [Streptomyces showdoensis]
MPGMIFVFERSLAVGSVPSIQMYSALKVTGLILWRALRVLRGTGLRYARDAARAAVAVSARSFAISDFPMVARL